YLKGACVIRMLENFLGAESFQCQFFNQESRVTLLPTTSTSVSEPLMTTGDVLERV
ncbi:hypothetical protein Droror1_Dr00017911, partial [Drosera rotundifolia]